MKKKLINEVLREILLRHLQELQADFEDLSDEELAECREAMLERVNECLEALGEKDEDNTQWM